MTLPPAAGDQIKKISEKRSAAQGRQITQINIHDEIVRELFKEIKTEKTLVFYSCTRRDKSIRPVRKTIWLPRHTLEIVKFHAKEFGLPDSTFILTAILRWFEKQGITFPGFLGAARALNILRINASEQKMPEPAPIRGRANTPK